MVRGGRRWTADGNASLRHWMGTGYCLAGLEAKCGLTTVFSWPPCPIILPWAGFQFVRRKGTQPILCSEQLVLIGLFFLSRQLGQAQARAGCSKGGGRPEGSIFFFCHLFHLAVVNELVNHTRSLPPSHSFVLRSGSRGAGNTSERLWPLGFGLSKSVQLVASDL